MDIWEVEMSTVMIVDDAAFLRMSLKTMMEKNGYQVVALAENGLIAVQNYMLYKPDIVTMDLTMPEMDGLCALKEIMQMDKNARIIVISALGQESKVKEAILLGAKNFIIKPYQETHVLDVLKKYCK